MAGEGQCHGRFGLGITNRRQSSDVVQRVEEAERLGAEVAFVSEDINYRDAFALCALGSQATKNIKLATGVVNPYTRNPTSLAMAAATLDEISGGRAILGLGTSSSALVEEQMGIPRGQPVRVMEEATQLIRGLLAGQTVNLLGDRFQYRQGRLDLPVLQASVPIFFAAMGPQMLRLAGKMADGVLLNLGASPAYVRWAVSQVGDGLREAGRTRREITIAAWMGAYVGDDFEHLLQRASEALVSMLAVPNQGELLLTHSGRDAAILADVRATFRPYPERGDRTGASRFVPREVVEDSMLVGTRERVRARVDQYREAGVDLPVVGPSALRALS